MSAIVVCVRTSDTAQTHTLTQIHIQHLHVLVLEHTTYSNTNEDEKYDTQFNNN